MKRFIFVGGHLFVTTGFTFFYSHPPFLLLSKISLQSGDRFSQLVDVDFHITAVLILKGKAVCVRIIFAPAFATAPRSFWSKLQLPVGHQSGTSNCEGFRVQLSVPRLCCNFLSCFHNFCGSSYLWHVACCHITEIVCWGGWFASVQLKRARPKRCIAFHSNYYRI